MRSGEEILADVTAVAAADDAVRAVIRTDLLPVREYLYALHFCFIVNDPEKYEDDAVFASCFGDRILLYRSDRNYPELFSNTKAHLMVFSDGLTLTIEAMDRAAFLARFHREQTHEDVWIGDTFQKILDKDGILPEISRPDETQTLFAQTPSEADFLGACSEFWWVMKTFAEYTLRQELPAAMYYLNVAVRELLHKMLRWHIFLRAGERVDMGILDSHMEKLLEKDWFLLYRKTFPDADYAHIREAFDAAAALWHRAAADVAQRCGFVYDCETEEKMLAFIRRLFERKNRSATQS